MRRFLKILIILVCCVVSLVLSRVIPTVNGGDVMLYILGIIGIFCWVRTILVAIFNRVLFDWQIINGHFLRKVVCLVLLTPFAITLLLDVCGVMPTDIAHDTTLFGPINDGIVEAPTLMWSVYYHFIDPGNQHFAITAQSRWWVSMISVLGIFLLNGLLVSTIIGWVDRRKERWLKGEISYERFLRRKSHYIIIGGNDMVVGIVRQLFDVRPKRRWLVWESKMPWVVIQTMTDVESLRRELSSVLTIEEQRHLIICHGSRTSLQDLRKLAPQASKEIFILGEEARIDDLESCHDTLNMECLKLISAICDAPDFRRIPPLAGSKIVCHIMFEYQTAYASLKVSDINTDAIAFSPFNPYEMWAQRLLVGKELLPNDNYRYHPLEGEEGIKAEDEQFVHLVIVGMSRMGVALGIEAAHLAHYPNFESLDKSGKKRNIRTRITFIDSNAAQEMAFFQGRFASLFELAHWRYAKSPELQSAAGNAEASEKGGGKSLYVTSEDKSWHRPNSEKYEYLGGDFLDIEWEFIHGNVESESVRKYLSDAVNHPHSKVTIAVCLPVHNRAVAVSLYLPREVYEKSLQVLVYQRNDDSMLREISKNNSIYNQKINPFGLAAKTLDFNMLAEVDAIATMVDRRYNEYMGYANVEVDDKSNKSWVATLKTIVGYHRLGIANKRQTAVCSDKKIADKTTAAKLWSSRYNAYSLRSKLRCVGVAVNSQEEFSAEQLELLGRVEHNRWNTEQLLLGYRPLTAAEQQMCMSDTSDAHGLKAEYKAKFAHLDICANEKLGQIDQEVVALDSVLTACLPKALRNYYNLCADANGELCDKSQCDSAENESAEEKTEKVSAYLPMPAETRDVELAEEFVDLVEKMAKNVHEVWAANRIAEGWRYGKVRDDARKEHPCLVPYEELPESEREYDRNTAVETLKLIIKLGSKVIPPKV